MKIELVTGCINDYLGVDNISEVNMTDEQRNVYFSKIIEVLPNLDESWFNYFLKWVCETFGEFNCSEKPCEQCGDYTITYTLNI